MVFFWEPPGFFGGVLPGVHPFLNNVWSAIYWQLSNFGFRGPAQGPPPPCWQAQTDSRPISPATAQYPLIDCPFQPAVREKPRVAPCSVGASPRPSPPPPRRRPGGQRPGSVGAGPATRRTARTFRAFTYGGTAGMLLSLGNLVLLERRPPLGVPQTTGGGGAAAGHERVLWMIRSFPWAFS